MQLKDVFIRNVKKYRKIRGVSQMILGELCHSSTSYIGQIEIGRKFPSIEMISKIARALHVKPHLLFFDESDTGEEDSEPAREKTYTVPDAVKDELLKRIITAVRQTLKKNYKY